MSDTSSTDAGTNTGSASDPTTTPTLDQVYDSFEVAFADFDTKLNALTEAQAAVTSSAQTVNDIKQKLDALEAQVDGRFDKVKPFLQSN